MDSTGSPCDKVEELVGLDQVPLDNGKVPLGQDPLDNVKDTRLSDSVQVPLDNDKGPRLPDSVKVPQLR